MESQVLWTLIGVFLCALFPRHGCRKWTDEEIDMLHSSIMRFSDDLTKISLSIKNRTV